MKVFITASAGVGKTAVVSELKRRGHSAYDVDDRELGLTRLEFKATGEPAEWPEGYVDWSYYSWNADQDRLLELLNSDETVYVAGILGNQEDLYKHFDVLIALTIDPAEHARRLRDRPPREVGDDAKNNQRRLEKYAYHLEKFISSGFILVENTGPVNQTVDAIESVRGPTLK